MKRQNEQSKIDYIHQYHRTLLGYSQRLKQLIDAQNSLVDLLRTDRMILLSYENMARLSSMMTLLEIIVSDLYYDLKAEEGKKRRFIINEDL